MINRIIVFFITLISIDIFYLIYKYYRKIILKQTNKKEEKEGLEKLSTEEDLPNKMIPIIVYSFCVFLFGIYFTFINPSIYTSSNLLIMIEDMFSYIFFIFFVYLTLCCLSKYLKNIILFFKGFKSGFFCEDIPEDNNLLENIDEDNRQ